VDIWQVVGVWAHALSTVIVLGYYGILGRIVVPALTRSMSGPSLGRAVADIERRALPFIALSVVAFIVSGAYLLVIDDQFAGIGSYTTSGWSTLMLVKHLLVGLMIVGAVAVHLLADRVGDPGLPDADLREGIRWVRLSAEGTTAIGALILLMTAAAQVG
jgi:uncharacterized membrane protein